MSMKQGLSVLLTGVGAPGVRGTLYALRNNPDHVPVRVVGVDIQSNAVGRYMVDQFYQIHPPESDGYIDSLRAMCERENIDVVIPQTTREITLLSHQSNQLDTPVMVSDANVIEIANNKWELLKFFQKMQLPHPQFQLSRSKDELIEATRILGYPTQKVIVKPPVSNGMRGFRILSEDGWDVKRFLTEKPSGVEITLNSLIEILHRGTEWPQLLVTEFLPGLEYSVDGFIGKQVSLAIPRLRRIIRSGISFDNAIELRDDLINFTLRAGQQMGLQYCFGFQFKQDKSGILKVLECNPRIQGTMVASTFAGVNIIWMGVQEALGIPTNNQFVLQEAEFFRYWGGLGVIENQVIVI